MSNGQLYFAQRLWQRTEQRQLIEANISELLGFCDRLIELSQNPFHYRASPKMQTARARLLEAIKALQDEMEPR